MQTRGKYALPRHPRAISKHCLMELEPEVWVEDILSGPVSFAD